MYSKMARDRAIRCAAMANQATDTGVRRALLDLSAAYMYLAGELARSKEVLDVTFMSMPQPPLHASVEEPERRAYGGAGPTTNDRRERR